MIQTKDTSKQDIIGKAKKLSSSDAGVVQKMYKCTGTVTRDIDECNSGPCKNGGTCTNRDGSYSCKCQDGWTGINCNQDINECDSGPCKNGGTCTNSDGSYSCSCQDGWKGNNCNQGTDTDTCMDKDDNCGDLKKYVFCKGDHEEYMSKKCAKSCGTCADIDEFNSGPCKNGGTCTNSDGSYSCSCQDGW